MSAKRKFIEEVLLEGVRIGFRNFAGAEDKFNRAGDRNFCIFLDTDIAEEMVKDGWNIKWLKARDDQEEDQAYIRVKVNFRNKPPRVYIVTSRNKTVITEDMLDILDWVDIEYNDILITPYHYNVSGKTGVTAYLKALYVRIQEDDLMHKYAELPDAGPSSNPLALESGNEDVIDAEVIDDPFGEPLELEQ